MQPTVASLDRTAPYSSAPHSARNPFVTLRKIVLGRKARSDKLFIVGTSRTFRNTSNCPAPCGTAGTAGDRPPASAPRPVTHPTAAASHAAAAPASGPASARAGRPAAGKPASRERIDRVRLLLVGGQLRVAMRAGGQMVVDGSAGIQMQRPPLA